MKSNLTCVSGYWQVTNKHNNKYNKWFKNTFAINCPYVFFTNKETRPFIESFRKDLPTYYIELNIEDFYMYQYRNRMITHPIHCPSIELNLIWNEKICLVEKALQINPFSSEYFCWIDAGICKYRNIPPPNKPFPNIDKLNMLPKDKFIYSASNTYSESETRTTNYYHHISATSYILHKNIITIFTKLYKSYIERLVDKNNIWTEQVILTHIYKHNKHIFHKLCDGYGAIIPYLY